MEPGLGKSESFYSWMIALFNIGAFIGAITCGCLVKYVPFWYLFMFSTSLHIAGYVLYAVTYNGWLMMVSKLLAGYFIGAETTLALAYFAKSSQEYTELMKEIGKKPQPWTALRNTLFSFLNLGRNIGCVLGPG